MRQPSACLYVKGTDFDQAFSALAEDELNVKNVVFTEDARAFTTYNLKPQMRTLGPKYGKLLGGIRTASQELDGNDVVDTFARGETRDSLTWTVRRWSWKRTTCSPRPPRSPASPPRRTAALP